MVLETYTDLGRKGFRGAKGGRRGRKRDPLPLSLATGEKEGEGLAGERNRDMLVWEEEVSAKSGAVRSCPVCLSTARRPVVTWNGSSTEPILRLYRGKHQMLKGFHETMRQSKRQRLGERTSNATPKRCWPGGKRLLGWGLASR